MKAQTIITIEKLLKKQVETAQEYYQSLKLELEGKYDTEWFEKYLSKCEKEVWQRAKENFQTWNEIYRDFCEHQW